MGTHKAIVLTDMWAGILSTLLASCVIGGVTFAWNAHGETAVLQDQVDKIQNANLPSRLDKLEEKVDYTNESLRDMKTQQAKLEDKIDLLVQKTLEPTKGGGK